MVTEKHDVLIVGGGLAGMRAALELQGKCDVAVLCKTYPNLAHSTQAQGGINAAIHPKDNWKDHFYDTVFGGDYLTDQDAAEVLCSDAPRAIHEMEKWGTPFTRTEDGKIAQRAFGGQRFKRTCFAADRTGHALVHTLYNHVIEKGVKIYDEHIALALLAENRQIAGVLAMDISDTSFRIFQTKAVILATGGAGRVYGKTTNPENTGDGIAIAYRAGLPIMDMEMIQFHPTTLIRSNKLLSEAARGEGAYLINVKGERFMKRYAPDKMELAPRDIVSRAITKEIMEGRGVNGDSVHLDFRHMDPDYVMKRLPDMHKNALELSGIDLLKDPVPVQSGQHYTMAGIACNTDAETGLSGLFVAGECANVSVHGANRLGGNSLMETLVFGRRAGKNALKYIKRKTFSRPSDTKEKLHEKKFRQWMAPKKDEFSARVLRIEMGAIMDTFVGPYRDGNMLKGAVQKISGLRSRFDENIRVMESAKAFNAELRDAVELDFMLDLAYAIAYSALHRTESRGAHYRTDYPERDDKNWLKHILLYRTAVEPRIAYRPVKITRLQPKERKY
ncbi:MAG TPA: FAD-dependent oxidoreductase [Candidatus Bilamarchaeaceae archaeon]|nr:FAD-dependent oxidoreductase [Candidatus Bilamarchaeaceae archaeon]